MITLGSLWAAVLVAAAIVWIATALAWMVLPHHKSDLKGLPNEAAVREVLIPQHLAPGMYLIPFVADAAAATDPEVTRRFEEGPVAVMAVGKPGRRSMARNLIGALVYYLAVSLFVAYAATFALEPETARMTVFRLTSVVAFLAYTAAVVQDALWFGKPWGFSVKLMVDGLVYGLLTGCVFALLWPSP